MKKCTKTHAKVYKNASKKKNPLLKTNAKEFHSFTDRSYNRPITITQEHCVHRDISRVLEAITAKRMKIDPVLSAKEL